MPFTHISYLPNSQNTPSNSKDSFGSLSSSSMSIEQRSRSSGSGSGLSSLNCTPSPPNSKRTYDGTNRISGSGHPSPMSQIDQPVQYLYPHVQQVFEAFSPGKDKTPKKQKSISAKRLSFESPVKSPPGIIKLKKNKLI
jgi:hypothetical protein